MKWMLVTTVAGALAISGAAGAQSAKSRDMTMKKDTMKAVYTGCIEPSPDGGFQLTDVDTGHDDMSMSGMSGDHMMSRSVRLTGPSNLDKHVGQKVTIKGSLSRESADGMGSESATLRVASLKVVSKSCSQAAQAAL